MAKYVIHDSKYPEFFHGPYSLDKAQMILAKLDSGAFLDSVYQMMEEEEHKKLLQKRKIDEANGKWVVYKIIPYYNKLSTLIQGVSAYEALKFWAKELQLFYNITENEEYIVIGIYEQAIYTDKNEIYKVLEACAHKTIDLDTSLNIDHKLQLLNFAAAKILNKAIYLYNVHGCPEKAYLKILELENQPLLSPPKKARRGAKSHSSGTISSALEE